MGFAALAFVLLAGAASALSNSGGGSWQNYTNVTISNLGGTLSNFQVLVNLMGDNFPINADTSGADIRFTDADGAELNYWIESWDYANRSANVWVNITSISTGTSTMRMLYGNPSATSSVNGTNTFVFFDDFLTLDSNVWDQYTSPLNATIKLLIPSIVELRSIGPGRTHATISLKKILPVNAFIKMKVTHTEVSNAGENGEYDIIEFGNLSTGRKVLIHYRGENPNIMLYWRSTDGPYSGPFSSLMTSFSRYNTDPHTWTIIRTTEPRLKVIRNDIITELDTTSDVPTAPFNGLSIQTTNGWDGSSTALQFDYFFVGKYASLEPSVSFGSKIANTSINSIGYSALIATGQNTYVQSSNGNFGLLLKGQSKTINNSVILNNTGDISAKVEARFNDSRGGLFGLVSGANVLNATNFALGIPSSLVPLNSSGADVQVAVAPPGVTALDARLGVPSEQASGDYSGTVVLTFSNNV